jgi:hypothetical protein
MAVVFNRIGVYSAGGEFIESTEATAQLETKMIMSSEGGFGAAKTYGVTYNFTTKGRGSTNQKAGDTTTTLVPDFLPTGGVCVVTSVKSTEKNDDYNEFEVSGTYYPEAAAIAQS